MDMILLLGISGCDMSLLGFVFISICRKVIQGVCKMTEEDTFICEWIAAHYPVCYADVVRIYFAECDKSFDDAVAYIEKHRMTVDTN